MRTYGFTYSNVYDSISVPVLAEMFKLDVNSVHALVSKMIISEEMMASLDQPSQCIVMHRSDPSKLQSIALQLSDEKPSLMKGGGHGTSGKELEKAKARERGAKRAEVFGGGVRSRGEDARGAMAKSWGSNSNAWSIPGDCVMEPGVMGAKKPDEGRAGTA